jgi:hypothetical protein
MERDYLEELDVGGRIILKCILIGVKGRVMDLFGSGQEQVEGCWKHGIDPRIP